MDLGEPGLGTSAVDELSEGTSEDSGRPLQIVVDKPMPQASHTSKRVRNTEENELMKKKKVLRKKRKYIQLMRNMRAA